jgi:hypothetical protein
MPKAEKAAIHIIFAQEKTEFRAGGEHTVGLKRNLGYEIVDEHADIGFVPPKDKSLFIQAAPRRVDPGHKPLRGCLFVTRCAVDLPRKIQALHKFRFKAVPKLPGGKKIVLYAVAIYSDADILKTSDCPEGRFLHFFWEGGREAIYIQEIAFLPFGLKEELVAFPLRETYNFIFDCRAVFRPGSAHIPRILRGLIKRLPYNRVRLRIRPGDITRKLGEVGEFRRITGDFAGLCGSFMRISGNFMSVVGNFIL